jgi:hypothetical protein
MPDVSVVRIGNEAQPVVVIDGFAPDPARLRLEAMGADLRARGRYYPGLRAAVGSPYLAEVGPLLAGAARHVFGASERLEFDRALFSLTCTAPSDLSLAQRLPHIDDVAAGRLAVVHYLSETDLGGTRFFRHRSTGFETVTSDRHRIYLDSLADDLARHGPPAPGYITGSTTLFEEICCVRPRYNRAIVYRSSLLHCAAIDNERVPSADVTNGRLTVASFLTAL